MTNKFKENFLTMTNSSCCNMAPLPLYYWEALAAQLSYTAVFYPRQLNLLAQLYCVLSSQDHTSLTQLPVCWSWCSAGWWSGWGGSPVLL